MFTDDAEAYLQTVDVNVALLQQAVGASAEML